eukprot:TRINITY_DN2383_c0_g1_i1.p1 TRINITY_DN2383_c0_g1~~TRINITY_DN2383_c0_g1_i1.p1  ORF type:complete len:268 (-),score=32.34 TRINITY_DN2383_c0_g1_i1:70-843(-)
MQVCLRSWQKKSPQSRAASFIPAHTWVSSPSATPNAKVGVLVHGLLGHKGNWTKFVRTLVERNPEVKILLVDLRNHGESTLKMKDAGELPNNTLDACSKDIVRLCCHLDIQPDFLVGHSFGGKVVTLASEGLVDVGRPPNQVWILDSLVNLTCIKTAEVEKIPVLRLLDHLHKIPLPVPSVKEFANNLIENGFSKDMALWMTTNLRRTPEGFVFKFDLDGIQEMIVDYLHSDLWAFLSRPPQGVNVHFVRAELSERW